MATTNELGVSVAAAALQWSQERTALFQKLLHNVVASPHQEKFRRLNLTNERIGALVAEPGARESFLTLGWTCTADGNALELPMDADLALTSAVLQTLSPNFSVAQTSAVSSAPGGTPWAVTVIRGPLRKSIDLTSTATVAALGVAIEQHSDLGNIPQARQRLLVGFPERPIREFRDDGSPITIEELALKAVKLEDMWEELVIKLRDHSASFVQLAEIFARPALAAKAFRENRSFVLKTATEFLEKRIAAQSLMEVKAARRCFQFLWRPADPATYSARVEFCEKCAFATVAGARPQLPSQAEFEAMDLRQQMRVVRNAAESEEATVEHFVLEVDRRDIFASSIKQVAAASPEELHKPLEVRFAGEVAEDAGGLRREFFNEFGRSVGRAEGLWRLTPAGALTPTHSSVSAVAVPDAATRQAMYRACGRIFGLALCQAQEAAQGDVVMAQVAEQRQDRVHVQPLLLGLPLACNFIRCLQGAPAETVEDLQAELRAEQHESAPDSRCDPKSTFLKQTLLENGLAGIYTFSYTTPQGNIVDLVPGGRDMEVLDCNKEAWLCASLRHELFDSIEEAADAFRIGVAEIVGASHLVLLSAPELREVWSGKATVSDADLEAWKARTEVSPAISQQAEWLFDLLRGDLRDARADVLKFATGSDRWAVDPSGFRFEIQPADGGDETLPSAMTCSNMLQLPRYSGQAPLRKKLKQAVELPVDLQKR